MQQTKYSAPEIASIAVNANQIDVNYAEITFKKSKNKAVLNFALHYAIIWAEITTKIWYRE